jgi:lipid-A-disaccharide synthase
MRVLLSTADASGDLHAAALVEALRKREPALEVFGLGGVELERAGLEPIVRQSEVAVAGLLEVVSSAPRILGGYGRLRSALRRRSPDLVVLVDSPDLNLPLASVAHRTGLPVLYYIAPQVWAWRPGRIRKLRRRVDHLAVIFPFEEALFREAEIPTTFVGHPLVDRIADVRRSLDPGRVAADLGIDRGRPVLGLLPGSRHNEFEHNLPFMVETAGLLQEAVPEVQIRLLLAPTLSDASLDLPDSVPVVRGRTHEAMAVSTCLLAAPGTVTVEAALLGVPLVVGHRVNRLSFELARRVARVGSSCMVNLIAGFGVVPERLQEQARPPAVAALLRRLIRDPEARRAMEKGLGIVADRLGSPGASERAADVALHVAGRA